MFHCINKVFYRRKLNPKKADKGVKRAAKAAKAARKETAAAEDSEEAGSEDDRG